MMTTIGTPSSHNKMGMRFSFVRGPHQKGNAPAQYAAVDRAFLDDQRAIGKAVPSADTAAR
jgi:hypothetical protein